MHSIHPARVRNLNRNPHKPGMVVYWMVRGQRVEDNWALLFAQKLALEFKQPLLVIFCLRKDLRPHLGTSRILEFILPNLQAIDLKLKKLEINFKFLLGDPLQQIPQFVFQENIGVIVTDFFPIRPYTYWHHQLSQSLPIAYQQVDNHNIVPAWQVSDKQEYAAQFFRRKINRLLPDFLTDFPQLKKHPFKHSNKISNDWARIHKLIKVDSQVKPISWLKPGEMAAENQLQKFLNNIQGYDRNRNDPNQKAQSNLSPYLHFGQISPQRVAYEISKLKSSQDKEVFLEELIVRRELADNYCFYQQHYDSPKAFPNWAQKTLAKHLKDRREYLYTTQAFESASTHDDLWNAAQLEMVIRGKMHGYLRMYWAKKILEWTSSPQEAMAIAISLNDKYSLDGRDPNGYAGIAWSIGGVHDRPWFDRPIFGQVRYMSLGGAKSKFKVEKYIDSILRLTK